MGNNQPWGARVRDEVAYARAGGRRRYNAQRQAQAEKRRRVVAVLLQKGLASAEIARRLKVHRSTVCRDIQLLTVRRCFWGGAPRTRREAAPYLASLWAYLEAGGDPKTLPNFHTVRGLRRVFGRR